MVPYVLLLNTLEIHLRRQHFLGGCGVKNWPNLPTDSSKKTTDGKGVRVKNRGNLPKS